MSSLSSKTPTAITVRISYVTVTGLVKIVALATIQWNAGRVSGLVNAYVHCDWPVGEFELIDYRKELCGKCVWASIAWCRDRILQHTTLNTWWLRMRGKKCLWYVSYFALFVACDSYYGVNCVARCSEGCAETCDVIFGECHCKRWWKENNCDTEISEPTSNTSIFPNILHAFCICLIKCTVHVMQEKVIERSVLLDG